jgi:hypothetical protein
MSGKGTLAERQQLMRIRVHGIRRGKLLPDFKIHSYSCPVHPDVEGYKRRARRECMRVYGRLRYARYGEF